MPENKRNDDFIAAALEEIDSLPPDVQATLRAGLLRFLSELGVQPMVDERSGKMVVDLKAISAALGMTEEEAMASMRASGADRDAISLPAERLKPMQ